MSSRRWQDHFPEAARASETTFEESGSPSALFYALERNLISESDYFAWAQNTFELPCLKMSFFSDHQADQGVWQKWKKHFAWQSDCLPLSEWDGTLYVACLEPREFPAKLKAVCLLTAPAGLKQMWMNYQSQTAFELQDSSTSEELNIDALPEANSFEPPAGMGAPQAAPELQPVASSPLVSLDPLKSLDLKSESVSTLDDQPPKDLDLDILELDPIAPAAVSTPALASFLTPLVQPVATPAVAAVETTPPAVAVAEAPVLEKATAPSELATKPTPKAAPPAVAKTAAAPAPQKAIPKVASASIYFFDNLLKKDNTPLNGPQIFSQMKTHFEKSMLLAVDTLEKTAKVLLWDEGFQAPPATSEIGLTDPSLFRIAVSTQHSYHGNVIQNAINDEFFASWNDSKIPDHITAVPIVIQDHVVGILIGFAGTESFNRTVLQVTEKMAANLALQIEGAQTKTAA